MSRGFWTPLTEIMSKWCGMFWRSFYFKQGRKPPHVSWEAFIAFERRLLFLLLLSLFYGTIFFAVEELSSVHGSKCMWTLVPRCRRCTMGPKPFEIAFFSLCNMHQICHLTQDQECFTKNFKRAHERVDLHYKGFKCEFIKGLARLPTFHHRRRRRRRR